MRIFVYGRRASLKLRSSEMYVWKSNFFSEETLYRHQQYVVRHGQSSQPSHLICKMKTFFHSISRVDSRPLPFCPWLFSFSDSVFTTETNLFHRKKITVWCCEQSGFTRIYFFLVIDRLFEWQSSTIRFSLINSSLCDTYSMSTTVFLYFFQFIIAMQQMAKISYHRRGKMKHHKSTEAEHSGNVLKNAKLNHESSVEFLKNSDYVITFGSCLPYSLVAVNVFSVHDSAIYLYDDKYIFFGEGWTSERQQGKEDKEEEINRFSLPFFALPSEFHIRPWIFL